ncbi:MAG TPA: T9SS type A sorting domain-containing protein, partial [Bacteroidales bacterium]|nr:T9SS type A sorting domain-containing protein [Bacteroidales bacterium]
QEAGIRLYPNPVVSVMEIESPFSGAVNVQVMSSSGKLVLDQHFNSGNKMELNLGPLSPGIYALKLISGSATVSEKILVR